jgi:hypothetical protein
VTGRRLLFAAMLALAALGAAVGVSFAAFSATTANSGNSFSARPDFVPPNATSSVIVRQGGGVAGYVRQGGSYYVYANVSDTGNPASGTASVTTDVSAFDSGQTAAPLASGSYATAGQTYNWRSNLLTANGTVSAGTYNYTLALADNAANSQVQTGLSVIFDNTAPTGSNIQATSGGTAGEIDVGDALTFTYSEPMDPTTILAGWDGSATTVAVTITAGNSATYSTNVALGSVALGQRAYNGTGVGATFSATMTMSGSNVTVTLASQTSGGSSRTMTANAMVWTPSTSATDRAGNACSGASASESGGSDADF